MIYALGLTSSSSGTARGAGPCSFMYRWASVSSVSTAAAIVWCVGLLQIVRARLVGSSAVAAAREQSRWRLALTMGCVHDSKMPSQSKGHYTEVRVPLLIAKDGNHIVSARGGQSGRVKSLHEPC